jgi:hypothetical protein
LTGADLFDAQTVGARAEAVRGNANDQFTLARQIRGERVFGDHMVVDAHADRAAGWVGRLAGVAGQIVAQGGEGHGVSRVLP